MALDDKWSWVVLAAGVLVRVIENGIYTTSGLLVPVLVPYLHASRSLVAFTGGLNLGIQCLFGEYHVYI